MFYSSLCYALDLTFLELADFGLGGASGLSAIRDRVQQWNSSKVDLKHRGAWSGLRHKPTSHSAAKVASPAFSSTPNLAFLNTSNLVKLECQTRNYKPFYDEYKMGKESTWLAT